MLPAITLYKIGGWFNLKGSSKLQPGFIQVQVVVHLLLQGLSVTSHSQWRFLGNNELQNSFCDCVHNGSNPTLVKVGGGIDPVTEVTHFGLNYPNLLTMGYCPPRLWWVYIDVQECNMETRVGSGDETRPLAKKSSHVLYNLLCSTQ